MRVRMAVAAIALLAVASVANAQSGYWWAGAGLTLPMGDTSDGTESGWMGTTGFGWNLKNATGWSLQAEGLYGKNNAKVGTGSMSTTALMGNASYEWNQAADMHPYMFAGAGMVMSKFTGTDSESDFGWQVGAGFTKKLNAKWNFWADARWLNSGSGNSKMTMMPILAGVSMQLGTP